MVDVATALRGINAACNDHQSRPVATKTGWQWVAEAQTLTETGACCKMFRDQARGDVNSCEEKTPKTTHHQNSQKLNLEKSNTQCAVFAYSILAFLLFWRFKIFNKS